MDHHLELRKIPIFAELIDMHKFRSIIRTQPNDEWYEFVLDIPELKIKYTRIKFAETNGKGFITDGYITRTASGIGTKSYEQLRSFYSSLLEPFIVSCDVHDGYYYRDGEHCIFAPRISAKDLEPLLTASDPLSSHRELLTTHLYKDRLVREQQSNTPQFVDEHGKTYVELRQVTTWERENQFFYIWPTQEFENMGWYHRRDRQNLRYIAMPDILGYTNEQIQYKILDDRLHNPAVPYPPGTIVLYRERDIYGKVIESQWGNSKTCIVSGEDGETYSFGPNKSEPLSDIVVEVSNVVFEEDATGVVLNLHNYEFLRVTKTRKRYLVGLTSSGEESTVRKDDALYLAIDAEMTLMRGKHIAYSSKAGEVLKHFFSYEYGFSENDACLMVSLCFDSKQEPTSDEILDVYLRYMKTWHKNDNGESRYWEALQRRKKEFGKKFLNKVVLKYKQRSETGQVL